MPTSWNVTTHGEMPKLHKPIFIEGLPGIGNVTKIALDFLVQDTNARKILSFHSNAFPPSVFVNDQNLIDLPSINLYHTKTSTRDVLFLSGDLQPVTEIGCYTFAHTLLEHMAKMGVTHLITLGGVGLNAVPKEPTIYCTGNNAEFIDHFSNGTNINTRPYGTIGPIVGISGLLLGLAQERNLPALTLLVETYSHPMYLGIDGGRILLKVLCEKLDIPFNSDGFDADMAQLTNKQSSPDSLPTNRQGPFTAKVNYIG